MREYAQRAVEWFKGLSTFSKVGVIVGLLLLSILAISISPLLIVVAIIAAAGFGFQALRQYGRDRDTRPSLIRALACLAVALLFVAFTTIFYGDDTTRVADQEPASSDSQEEQTTQDSGDSASSGGNSEDVEQEQENEAEREAEKEQQEEADGGENQQDRSNQEQEDREQGQRDQDERQDGNEGGLFDGLLEEPEEEAGLVEKLEPIVLSGSGDTVTEPIQVEEGLGVFNMSHQGQGNFVVEETSGTVAEMDSLLVNKIGAYSGANASNLTGGELILEVDADGPWEIVVNQPRTNEGSEERMFSGESDSVTPLIELESGNVTVDMEHQGGGNFVVELLDENGQPAGWDSLVANEIEAYTGSTSVEIPSDGKYVLDVEADGPWAIELN